MEIWMDGWVDGWKRWLYFMISEVILSCDNLLYDKSTSLFLLLPLKDETKPQSLLYT